MHFLKNHFANEKNPPNAPKAVQRKVENPERDQLIQRFTTGVAYFMEYLFLSIEQDKTEEIIKDFTVKMYKWCNKELDLLKLGDNEEKDNLEKNNQEFQRMFLDFSHIVEEIIRGYKCSILSTEEGLTSNQIDTCIVKLEEQLSFLKGCKDESKKVKNAEEVKLSYPNFSSCFSMARHNVFSSFIDQINIKIKELNHLKSLNYLKESKEKKDYILSQILEDIKIKIARIEYQIPEYYGNKFEDYYESALNNLVEKIKKIPEGILVESAEMIESQFKKSEIQAFKDKILSEVKGLLDIKIKEIKKEYNDCQPLARLGATIYNELRLSARKAFFDANTHEKCEEICAALKNRNKEIRDEIDSLSEVISTKKGSLVKSLANDFMKNYKKILRKYQGYENAKNEKVNIINKINNLEDIEKSMPEGSVEQAIKIVESMEKGLNKALKSLNKATFKSQGGIKGLPGLQKKLMGYDINIVIFEDLPALKLEDIEGKKNNIEARLRELIELIEKSTSESTDSQIFKANKEKITRIHILKTYHHYLEELSCLKKYYDAGQRLKDKIIRNIKEIEEKTFIETAINNQIQKLSSPKGFFRNLFRWFFSSAKVKKAILQKKILEEIKNYDIRDESSSVDKKWSSLMQDPAIKKDLGKTRIFWGLNFFGNSQTSNNNSKRTIDACTNYLKERNAPKA